MDRTPQQYEEQNAAAALLEIQIGKPSRIAPLFAFKQGLYVQLSPRGFQIFRLLIRHTQPSTLNSQL